VEDKLRRARNESLFRDVNERIAESAERFDSESAEFVCECADAACTDRVHATLETYDAVREDGTQFLVAPGHDDPDIERVVVQRPRYAIVAKVKNRLVAETVRRLNPRAANA
jgi:hypothetical protein